jgi:hypothetical protein
MNTTLSFKHLSRAALALSVLSGASLSGVACSSDKNEKPREPVIIGTGGAENDGGGTGGKTNSTGGKKTSASGGGSQRPDASTGASSGSGGSSGDDGGSSGGSSSGGSDASPGDSGSGGASTECTPSTGPKGCFNCPSTTEQFLHQCTTADVQCAPYDNSQLGLFNGYPLPEVP